MVVQKKCGHIYKRYREPSFAGYRETIHWDPNGIMFRLTTVIFLTEEEGIMRDTLAHSAHATPAPKPIHGKLIGDS
jgi:hypothetical protein